MRSSSPLERGAEFIILSSSLTDPVTIIFLSSVTLYAGGFRSIGEAVDACRRYGRKRRLQLENWTGGIELSKNDPDKIATKGMSEEEELNYVLKNYFPDDMLKDPDESSSKK